MNTDDHQPIESLEQAATILRVAVDADEQQVRDAYIKQIKAHPPDIDPQTFEQVRDAYQVMCDPHRQTRRMLESPDPTAPLVSLLDEGGQYRFVGPDPWLTLIKQRDKP